jgi:hypothetical protein
MYPAQFPLAFSTVVSFLGRLDSRANSPSRRWLWMHRSLHGIRQVA